MAKGVTNATSNADRVKVGLAPSKNISYSAIEFAVVLSATNFRWLQSEKLMYSDAHYS